MKKLETQFTCNADKSGDHIFTLVKREDNICIYERKKDKRVIGYEVFITKVICAGTPLPGGNVVKEDYEQYPGKSMFGKTAWFCGDLNHAEELFDKLINKKMNTTENNTVNSSVDNTVVAVENNPATVTTVETKSVEVDNNVSPAVVETTPVEKTTVTPTTESNLAATVEVNPDSATVNVITVETKPEQKPAKKHSGTPKKHSGTSSKHSGKKKTEKKKTEKKPEKKKVEVKFHYPKGQFTQAEFAKANKMPERGRVYGVMQKQISLGLMKFVKSEKRGAGKPTSIYAEA